MRNDKLGSYEKVNYLLRLRKQIERKMIIEMLQKMDGKLEINKYKYLGLGSIYFADFILFHKYLHIENLISLEKDKKKEIRFRFNLPFNFVDLKMKSSSVYLKKNLKGDSDSIFMWLDYDGFIDFDMLEDIELVSRDMKPNDIFIVTINADLTDNFSDIKALEEFLEEYREYIGSDINAKYAKKKCYSVLHRMIMSAMSKGFIQRPESEKVKISQLLNLAYKDTAEMYTFGCIFEETSSNIIRECDLKKLNFIRTGKKVFKIDCPLLTPKEKIHLDSCIDKNKKCIDLDNKTGLSKRLLDRYSICYKYYPQFFESIY